MCLTVTNKNGVFFVAKNMKDKPKPIVATRNMRVFKRLVVSYDKRISSPYRGATYKLGETKSERTISAEISRWSQQAKVHRGLHAYRSQPLAGGNRFEAIVPKGAKYFFGHNNEIVATKLTLLDNKHNRALIEARS